MNASVAYTFRMGLAAVLGSLLLAVAPATLSARFSLIDTFGVHNGTTNQEAGIEMPTAFSPNGDGANDLFVIHGLEEYPKNTLTVVNRWGNVVFDRFNYANNWAGENLEGQPLPDGTYFVRLAVNGGEITWQGFVELRR